eukprot:CAMPEP_0119369430 /NCGR_PEP_ID=MMETSP1334-20130426/15936_1 /TAXON_ID=127549 /ORGANISM="Calcidiscus leptoporus, Strain RCC1130" /LENGTH=113 /DNA_ID=CAMNT_0007386269 /DNA_START=1 /DNA_END=339 /DNA_ORIENTATION=-
MGYHTTAVLYSNDGYGEAYKEKLVGHCSAVGIAVQSFSYDAGSSETIAAKVRLLAASKIHVVMMVATGNDVVTAMEAAHQLGIVGEGSMWVFSDGSTASDLDQLRGDVRRAVH